MSDTGREETPATSPHRVTWFAPDRPVEGTVYVKPASHDSAPDDHVVIVSADA
jgi:hypothetical protein